MNAPQIVHAWGPWVGGLLAGLLPFLVFWRDGRQARRRERADLIRIAQDAAGALIEDLREEIKRGNADRDQLRRRVEEVEHELAEFRRMHDAMIADKDAELAILRGENRQLKALLESHRRLMEAAGLKPPPLTQQIWLVAPGDEPTELEATT